MKPQPAPYEVWMAEHPLGKSDYPRFWLILSIRPGDLFGCFSVSTDCHGFAADCFCLDQSQPDFAATGLRHTCHVGIVRIFDVPLDRFKSKRGALTGELLVELRKKAGI